MSAWAYVLVGILGLILKVHDGSAAPPLNSVTALQTGSRVWVPAGRFAPLFGLDKGQTDFQVRGFAMDRYPVTQRDYLEFLSRRTEWTKNKVPRLYADSRYLSDWKDGRPVQRKNAPVVFVSWFAATSFCEARGGRLPTTLEWEYAAAASEDKADASRDAAFVERILAWYGKPSSTNQPVGRRKPNYYGIHDLHGLVWEWTSDFNGSFVTADNRADGDQSKSFFCGSGVTGAAKREDYAAFMRYAMRNSLGPDFAVMNVGFRCAYDQK